ncbi:hypothetical protein GCM10010339_46220 [Streptomyces alanosinicus]|uniref:Uncharacterized protein n=1 Tax=Streptomyces alanosinicus TaxID=68171 RepID=A0A918YK99_9ACTN|nr:hypothetical protein GCM10010339_46220 [Streptomyces alanosinicus]
MADSTCEHPRAGHRHPRARRRGKAGLPPPAGATRRVFILVELVNRPVPEHHSLPLRALDVSPLVT